MAKQRIPHSPTAVQRDHARPWAAPAPSAAAVQARLAELVVPAPDARADEYRRPGHRWRILTLPVLVALVLAMIWRQVPSGSSLAAMLAHEGLLWAPPRRVSQPALSLRLRMLSAELFAALLGAVLPFIHAQAAGRSRPLPRPAARARAAGYGRVWILDASTLEALFQRVGLLRRAPGTPLGGKLLAVLDAARTLPVRRWHGRDATANGKSFLEIPPAGLLLDRGFSACPRFDWLTDHAVALVPRLRAGAAVRVVGVLADSPTVRDRVVRLGQRRNPCEHPLRLVEVLVGATWHGYLTNALDPARRPAADVVARYGERWRVEEAVRIVKRLLGLSDRWTGSDTGTRLQVWATWLLDAARGDRSDAGPRHWSCRSGASCWS
jgi:hypothetical protein